MRITIMNNNKAKFLVESATDMFKKAINKIERANAMLEGTKGELHKKQDYHMDEMTQVKYKIMETNADIEKNEKLINKLKEFSI